ncbi:Transcriptional regulator [Frankia sp. AiPs1]|uniref:IclR family transcriptional regulator n=1 Tax=Frankia sp. AiPa1 TaxID=573492 RepID=UPI00202B6D0D|nr:IclR family transcriptional regulator [Frankia sp. AiPa1]MCL9762545.1 IclR family transcriptional regulator [Frankia sp. AiPa1]
MKQLSGVGVLDKAALILTAVEEGPVSLTELVTRTELTRATAHRLASALEVHGLVGRDSAGRFVAGPRLAAAGIATPLPWDLVDRADGVLTELRRATGESTQLYVRRGALRLCVAASERASGLRDTVPVGAALPMTAGSGAQVLLAYSDEPEPELLEAAPFDAATLAQVRERGWAQSVGERETGLASVSAPVRGADGAVIAAISLSGPQERLTRSPGRRHGAAVVAAAARLSTSAPAD